jgi:hypothetical protein
MEGISHVTANNAGSVGMSFISLWRKPWIFQVLLLTLSLSEIGESSIPFEPDFEPGNSLGIFTETITNIQRWAGDTKMLKEIKIKYLGDGGLEAIKEVCETNRYSKFSDAPGDEIQFGNCSFSTEWASSYEYTGVPEFASYNYTVKQVRLKSFRPQELNEDGHEVRCILKHLMQPKFYAAVMRMTVFGSDPIYKLDGILTKQLEFFDDVIEPELVYQFDPVLDFLSPPPMYRCIVSIMSGATKESIRKNCPISCVRVKDERPVQYDIHDEL